MILLAMDLNKTFEQSEVQEMIHKETKENLAQILEDQTLVFENSSQTHGADDVSSRAQIQQLQPIQHLKSGSVVIGEYLHLQHKRHH